MQAGSIQPGRRQRGARQIRAAEVLSTQIEALDATTPEIIAPPGAARDREPATARGGQGPAGLRVWLCRRLVHPSILTRSAGEEAGRAAAQELARFMRVALVVGAP